MKNDTFKIAGIISISIGAIYCITIEGIIFGLPLIIGGIIFNNYSKMDYEQIKYLEKKVLWWTIFFLIFSFPSGVFALVGYISLKNVDKKREILGKSITRTEAFKTVVDIKKIIPSKETIVTSIKSTITNKFYDEEKLILGKYKDIQTPNYILIQLREMIKNTDNQRYMYDEEFILTSNKNRNKFRSNASYFPLKSYYTRFDDLNQHQLNWYLYWRREFLNNNIIETDLSYIYLFAYELINYSFNEKASFNISVLEKLNLAYIDVYKKLYLKEWLEDMLYEVDRSDLISKEDQYEQDRLYSALIDEDTELTKIPITVWRKHYSEHNTNLSNRKIKYLTTRNTAFYSKFKNYMGKLINYYKNNNIKIEKIWFEEGVETERKSLFNYVGPGNCFDRKEVTIHKKVRVATEQFYSDTNDITNICYDKLVSNKITLEDYDLKLPECFIETIDKKNSKTEVKKEIEVVTAKVDYDFDISDIKEEKINVETRITLEIEKVDMEFFKLFEGNRTSKNNVKKHCMNKGKFEKVYVDLINEKYFDMIGENIIIKDKNDYILTINDDLLKEGAEL